MHRTKKDPRSVELFDVAYDNVGTHGTKTGLDGILASNDRFQTLALHPQDAVVDRVKDVILGGDVVVERPFGDSCSLADVRNRGSLETPFGEQALSLGEDPLLNGRDLLSL
jgi:hypothetical protein